MGLAMAELQVNRRYMEPSKLAFPCVIAGTMAAAAGTIKANAVGQQSKPVMTVALVCARGRASMRATVFQWQRQQASLLSINKRIGMAPFFADPARTSSEE